MGQDAQEALSSDDIAKAEKLAGVSLTEEQRSALARQLQAQRRAFDELRNGDIPNDLAPMTPFVPQGKVKNLAGPVDANVIRRDRLRRPNNDEDLAFMTVAELGQLIRTKQVTSRELTELSLRRLKDYGPRLLNLVSLTEERALAHADLMDAEVQRGRIRSHLHGIPYGIKDLFAAKGAPTTWGAQPYREQVIDHDSKVVQMLESAGAVLCAKLACGALAMGDVWFAGTCRNPWNPTQGSSGSSAGSASAMAAGLVPFTIGTETLGSIVSPSQRCRVTGFRPTFGRVSRAGAMTLSWTMDKVGPICRTAEDCALVLTAIVGADPDDPASVNR
ncbi:MAG: amidase, partial [Fimbriimonadaceae bacterium]|nr:amidase [Fimbriimonadaceae bacterium]